MKKKVIGFICSVLMATMLIGSVAMASPKKMSDGGMFDAQYYAACNPDVVEVFGTDENTLYQHYKNNGKKEGRLPYDASSSVANESEQSAHTMSDGGMFDPQYYAAHNPDVVAVLGNDENVLYQHYLNNGKKEGRLPYDAASSMENKSERITGTTTSTQNFDGLKAALKAQLGTNADSFTIFKGIPTLVCYWSPESVHNNPTSIYAMAGSFNNAILQYGPQYGYNFSSAQTVFRNKNNNQIVMTVSNNAINDIFVTDENGKVIAHYDLNSNMVLHN